MPHRIILAAIALAISIAFLTLGPDRAEAQYKTFVSPAGDDTNNCFSPTIPCRQISVGVSKAAAGGSVHVLPGEYSTFIITKSIEIIADQGTYIASTGYQDNAGQFAALNITASANDVVRIRGININGLNFNGVGISFNSGAALELEDCRITQGGAGGLHIIPNAAAGGGVPTSITVKNSYIGLNTGGNVLIAPTAGLAVNAVFDRVTTSRGAFGIKADSSASGKIRVDARDSISNDNTNNGHLAVGNGANPVHFMIERSTASGNGAYGAVASGAQAFMIATTSTFVDNGTGLAQLAGSTVASTGTNTINFNTNNTSGTITLQPPLARPHR